MPYRPEYDVGLGFQRRQRGRLLETRVALDGFDVAQLAGLSSQRPNSDGAILDRAGDPRNDLIEHLVERCRRLETENSLSLLC